MEFSFQKKGEGKNQKEASMARAGSSKIPPFEKKEVGKSHPDGSAVGSAGSSIGPPPVHHQDGKWLVKLWIPKSGEEIEEGDGSEINRSEWNSPSAAADAVAKKKFTHFCRECNKGFVSGKALGGHMSSAHVQAKDYQHKLKIKKSEKLLRGYESNPSDADHEKFLCPSCGKAFGSSKSLYGHMRCHPERYWRGMEPPSSKEPNQARLAVADDEDDGDDDGDHDGDESKEENVLEDFDDVEDSADGDGFKARVDLAESLSGWTVTGKRGREGLKQLEWEMFADNEEEKQKVYDAVSQLMRLVNEEPVKADDPVEKNEVTSKNSSTPDAEFKAVFDEVRPGRESTDFLLKKRKFNEIDYSADESEEILDEAPLDKGRGKFKSTAPMGSEISSEKSLSSEYLKDCGLFIGNDLAKNFSSDHEFDSLNAVGKNRRKVKKVMNKGPKSGEIIPVNQRMDLKLEATQEKHKCSTCKKNFPTHQALGGHRASHNKQGKVNIQNTVDHGSVASLPARDENNQNHSNSLVQLLERNGIEGGGDASKVSDYIHECNICGKIFLSGQALGGHKRCHYAGTSSHVESSDGGGSDKSERKILEFDLNIALEEDPNVAGYGSSYVSHH